MISKKALFLLLFFGGVLFGEVNYRVTNTNITVSQGSDIGLQDKRYEYNYNRLRLYLDYSREGYFGSVIGDGVNYFGDVYTDSESFEYLKNSRSDTPFDTQTNFKDYGDGAMYAKLYRAYVGYEDAKNRAVAGLQNISMGVGRIWTPTNIFNPKNSYAIEPDEIYGVSALSYVRHLSDTSHVALAASQNSQKKFKYRGGYKGYLGFADVGVNVVYSDKTKMLAYEIEGNLADTGVELRSEAGYIKSTLFDALGKEYDIEFFQGIVGAEYGFVNGVTLLFETLYGSKDFTYEERILNLNSDIFSNLLNSNFYSGVSISYGFNLFLDASLLYIESFADKNSRFISPSLSYTLNDYNTFTLGAQILDGKGNSEFRAYKSSYFFKWSLSF
jgi:hypothetical protein